MKQWTRFSIVELLAATVVLSIGIYLNFTTQTNSSYRKYGWPLTAVEFQIYPRTEDSYGPEFEQLAYRTQKEYWMPIRSVDTPGCIILNSQFFLGLSLLVVRLNRRFVAREQSDTPNFTRENPHSTPPSG